MYNLANLRIEKVFSIVAPKPPYRARGPSLLNIRTIKGNIDKSFFPFPFGKACIRVLALYVYGKRDNTWNLSENLVIPIKNTYFSGRIVSLIRKDVTVHSCLPCVPPIQAVSSDGRAENVTYSCLVPTRRMALQGKVLGYRRPRKLRLQDGSTYIIAKVPPIVYWKVCRVIRGDVQRGDIAIRAQGDSN